MFKIHLINYIEISCSNFRYLSKVKNCAWIGQKWKKGNKTGKRTGLWGRGRWSMVEETK